MIEVRETALADWNEFVRGHPRAVCYHLYQWKTIIENAYGLPAHYLGAYSGDRLVGVLPTGVLWRPFRRRLAVSMPFCSFAGWLLEPGQDEEPVMQGFLAGLRERGVSSLELRAIDYSDAAESEESTLMLDLPASHEVLWKQLSAKVRNLVRNAQRSGLVVQRGADQVAEFCDVYSLTMAQLGSPSHSRSFFVELCERLPENTDIVTVRSEGRAVAAMVLVRFRGVLTNPWAASLREYRSMSPNMLLYWEALKRGCDEGMERFDFGRSNIHSGTYRFKTQWGAEPYPLAYRVISVTGADTPSSVSFYRGARASILSRLWKHLPYPVARRLGPMLRKHIP
jgi:FemAB-related protein (PEP-CTERM system-associated)